MVRITKGDGSMSHSFKASGLAAAVAALLVASSAPAFAAATPAQKCEAGKNSTAGKYAACMHKAQQKYVNGGELDLLGRDNAEAKCASKLDAKFASQETKAGLGICPSEMDQVPVRDFIDECVVAVEDALHGGSLPVAVNTCNADLATCEGDLDTCGDDLAACASNVGVMKTGATQCSNVSGMIIPCAGSGQDAEYQAGVTASYTDNGDGTVTDNLSGLMWEKLSDDGSIHDWNNTYSWTNAFASKIATLNGSNFAGHNDWRLPNIKELSSIINYGVTNSSVYSQFSNGCTPACTVLTCSCNTIASYWSSTTVNTGNSAWVVFFSEGRVLFTLKTGSFYVRAVRGGL
jgi:hypothetical protein